MRSTAFGKITAVYGQNGQKWPFVRKIRVKSWCISQNKKKSAPSLARISNHCSVVAFGSTPCINRVPARIPPIASKDSLDETSSPSVAQRLRTGSCPFGFTPCPNQAQTSNKAHDKFVPRRDCACADHSRPSLSTALLSGWSSHLV